MGLERKNKFEENNDFLKRISFDTTDAAIRNKEEAIKRFEEDFDITKLKPLTKEEAAEWIKKIDESKAKGERIFIPYELLIRLGKVPLLLYYDENSVATQMYEITVKSDFICSVFTNDKYMTIEILDRKK